VATTYATKIVVSATDNASGAIAKIGKAVTGHINKLAGGVRSLASGVAKTTEFLGNLNQARMLIAGAVSSAGDFIQGLADTGDELGAFADKTGLSVEAIQAWRYAAEQSDVETEMFNASIERFAVGLAAAKAGTGPLAAGLKKLSPALLEQLKKTSDTEEALGLYVAAMEQLPDASNRAMVAGIAFGKGNKDMALLAVQGTEALKKLREQKLKDGVVSTEQAKKAGEVDGQLKRLKSQYDGIKATIGGSLLPVMAPLLEKLSGWIERNKELIGQKIEGAIKAMGDAIVSVDWESVWGGIKAVWEWLGKVKSFYDDNIAPIIAAFGGWGDMLVNLFEVRLVYALGKSAAAAAAAAAAATGAATATAAAGAAAAGGAGPAVQAVIAARAGGAAAGFVSALAAPLPFLFSSGDSSAEVSPEQMDYAQKQFEDAVDSGIVEPNQLSANDLVKSYRRSGAAQVQSELGRRGYGFGSDGAISSYPDSFAFMDSARSAMQENKITVEIKTAPGVEATTTVSGPGKATVNTGARQVGTGAP